MTAHDPVLDVDIPVLVMYPCAEAESARQLGPYLLTLAWDAQPLPGRFPVVLISHGSGGTHLGYRDLAKYIAARGFVVAMPLHPGNNHRDNALADSDALLAQRPRHLSLVLDVLATSPEIGASALTAHTAVVGHSMGGYTALAVAGGRPATPRGVPVDVEKDERVQAIVLFAPATPWFMGEGALVEVDVPVLLYVGKADPHTGPWHGQIVTRGLSEGLTLVHREIDNAGHFSFMSPFPDVMVSPSFPPGNDPDGFDRSAYLPVLQAEVFEFLAATL